MIMNELCSCAIRNCKFIGTEEQVKQHIIDSHDDDDYIDIEDL